MSKAYQLADALAARLTTIPGCKALVYRQKDLTSEVAQAVGKTGGSLALILYAGFENPGAAGIGSPNITRKYTISLFSRPVLSGRETPADTLVEAMAASIQSWEPDETLTGSLEINVLRAALRVDDEYLIYDLDLTAISRL